MASAKLPSPDLTAEERDRIVAAFGGEEDFTAALSGWLADEVERRAAATAREATNVAVREAVEQAAALIPETVRARPVEVIAPVDVEAVKG